MPLRNSELPRDMREPHQTLPGAMFHSSQEGIVFAYVNLLEERIYVLDLELSAMRDRFGHQLNDDEVAAKRDEAIKNAQEEVSRLGELSHARMKRIEELGETVTKLQQDVRDIQAAAHGAVKDATGWRERYEATQNELATSKLETQEWKQRYETMKETSRSYAEQPISHSTAISLDYLCGRISQWNRYTFGEETFVPPAERGNRVFEEATELAQALGCDQHTLFKIMQNVFSKPPGDIPQELGGVIVTWAIATTALGYQGSQIASKAAKDCMDRTFEIREKHKLKIEKGFAVPFHTPTTEPRDVADARMAATEATGAQERDYAAENAAIIKEGRLNLEAFTNATRQPLRGDDLP